MPVFFHFLVIKNTQCIVSLHVILGGHVRFSPIAGEIPSAFIFVGSQVLQITEFILVSIKLVPVDLTWSFCGGGNDYRV